MLLPTEPVSPKISNLRRAQLLGLPVPSWIALASCADITRAETLLSSDDVKVLAQRKWPCILRAALLREDSERGSLAGLGHSVADVSSPEDLPRAMTQLLERMANDEILALVLGRKLAAHDWEVLLQEQVARKRLFVVVGNSKKAWIEAYQGAGDVLAQGVAPEFQGLLADFDLQIAAVVFGWLEKLETAIASSHGLDLEIIEDASGELHLVQCRPLVAGLPAVDAGFEKALANYQAQHGQLVGRYSMDGEHNPAPLSAAHQWLIEVLAQRRPKKSGDPIVVGGWLYLRVLPKNLAKPNVEQTADPRETLRLLLDVWIVEQRASYQDFLGKLNASDAQQCVELLEHAIELFLQMIDTYVDKLIPARASRPAIPQANLAQPASLTGRGGYLDVLPATWDIRSPPLSTWLGAGESRQVIDMREISETHAYALLGELDDNLFALGLAPIRSWYLHAASLLGAARWHAVDDVFSLDATELQTLILEPTDAGWQQAATQIEARRRQEDVASRWTVPAKLHDGHSDDSSYQQRVIALGKSCRGRICVRRDLADLLQRPAPAGSVLCMPSLTAQAAVVVERFSLAAICTQYGSQASHGALMARELSITALLGAPDCMAFAEGTEVYVDTARRRIFSASQPLS